MIVPMLKYSFLMRPAEYEPFLNGLKHAGVVHIQVKENEPAAEMQEMYRRISDINRVINRLATIKKNTPAPASPFTFPENDDLPALIAELENSMEQLRREINTLEKEEKIAAPWGEFSTDTLHILAENGVTVRFLTTPVRKYRTEWENIYNIHKIDDANGIRYFIKIEHAGNKTPLTELPGVDEIKLPNKTSTQLRAEIAGIRNIETELQNKLNTIAHHETHRLVAYHHQLAEKAEEMHVRRQTTEEAGGALLLVEGWAPESRTSVLNSYLNRERILYIAQKPDSNDKVPVLLKNSRFAQMFEFIGELYDLPNYHERDLTAFFAPFYVIFFGLCLGDAGYGLLFLLLGLAARIKIKEPAMKPIMSLIAVLGGAAIVMGTVSGTFFGIPLLETKWEWIQQFKGLMLDSNKLFYNALLLGVIQILFGMILKWTGEIKHSGFLSSLPTLGWLLLLTGCGTMYGLSHFSLITASTAQTGCLIFGISGAVCIFLLNNLRRNPLINVGAGLWDTYNMATGLLGDVLSYIRLFALGLSGGVMGLVFNDLAISMGSSINIPAVSQLITLFILLFGHGINIFIAALGSFVHPMRLTFVEFYKNAGFNGGGKKYKPFAKYKKEKKVM